MTGSHTNGRLMCKDGISEDGEAKQSGGFSESPSVVSTEVLVGRLRCSGSPLKWSGYSLRAISTRPHKTRTS